MDRMKRMALAFSAFLMILYLFGSVISETKLGLADGLAYITFLASRGEISMATGYYIWLTIYILAAIVLLFLAALAGGGKEEP